MSGERASEAKPASGLDPEVRAKIAEGLVGYVPHNRALGLRFEDAADDSVTIALPYDEKLVGNPLTGVLHGGAITALMDATCGTAIFFRLREAIPIATLDLRIDYLKPATPHLEVYARAECFKLTQNIAFVRCEAYHPGAERDLVAVANGTFILTRSRPRKGKPA
jgi:uncharacterized protein (TIGR00369 family)